MTVTVITSSIGRSELRQCIESVRAQTHPARHMIYVNGPKYHGAAQLVLREYPDVHAFYLPEETGDYGTGGSMADVFAAAPFLTRSDWVFYLDDDNFYEPDHIQSVMTMVKEHHLEWAYSLRRLVDKDGQYICDDDWCSIGAYQPRLANPGTRILDNSCFAVSRRLAQRYALAWTVLPIVADRCFQMVLTENGHRHGCTAIASVNYRLGTGTANATREQVLAMRDDWFEKSKSQYPDGFPWRTPQVFGNKPA